MTMQPINKGQIRLQFTEAYQEQLDYEDKLPEGVTEEDVMEKYGKVVWCEFTDCFWNNRIKDLQKTWGTINGNPKFQPIAPHEMVWNGICSRPNEIVLRFKSVRDASGGRVKVPYCYTAASNGKTGHVDFASMLQGDGTPFGGNIDSQNSDMGGQYYDPWSGASMGRERIVNWGGQESKSKPTSNKTIGE